MQGGASVSRASHERNRQLVDLSKGNTLEPQSGFLPQTLALFSTGHNEEDPWGWDGVQ